MTWYYAHEGRQMGPVDEAALDDLVQRGTVGNDTLVWHEGMAAWQTLAIARPRPMPSIPVPTPAAPIPVEYAPVAPAASQASASSQAAATMGAAPGAAPSYSPPQAADMRYCAECGRPFPAPELSTVGNVAVCPTCRPVVMHRMGPMAPAVQPAMAVGRRYAGFWIRFVAVVIDAILIGIVSLIITLPLSILMGGASIAVSRDPTEALAALPAMMGVIAIGGLVRVALFAAYEIYFVSTRGATPGKMALGLKVVQADGSPVPVGLSAGRHFAKYLSAFIMFIGYIMAGFDPEKRALHDRICETRVVYAR